jgi:hypothetical protein
MAAALKRKINIGSSGATRHKQIRGVSVAKQSKRSDDPVIKACPMREKERNG